MFKMLELLLYWFAGQQQNNICRHQKFCKSKFGNFCMSEKKLSFVLDDNTLKLWVITYAECL